LGLLYDPILHALRSQVIIKHRVASSGQGPLRAIKATQIAIRNGLFQRTHLRTSFLHDVDPLFNSQPHAAKREYAKKSKRVVYLEGNVSFSDESFSLYSHTRAREVEPMGSPCCQTEPYYFLRDFEKPFFEKCTPKVEELVYPTCNVVHELAQHSDIELLSLKGSWRSVWKVEGQEAVMKMLSLERDFDRLSIDNHATDIMTMERLTASPYIVNAYGFCSQSVLTEMAHTTGRDYIKQNEIRTRHRLKMARDLARGLADLQAFHPITDYRSSRHPPTLFAHNDINIANTVQVGGNVKWNDFNIGLLLRQRNNTDCGAPVRYKADLWRSPEEIFNASYVRLEQSDIYGLGNIMYQVMTRHQPWTHKEPGGKLTVEEIVERKKSGQIPTIPEQYKNSTRTEMHALLFATLACYHPRPDKRPTSFELARALGTAHDWVTNKKRVSVRQVRDLFMK
jgi:serine/threonine protein kinase